MLYLHTIIRETFPFPSFPGAPNVMIIVAQSDHQRIFVPKVYEPYGIGVLVAYNSIGSVELCNPEITLRGHAKGYLQNASYHHT